MSASPTAGPQQVWSVLDGLPSSQVRTIEPAPERVWLGTSNGPASIDRGTGSVENGYEDHRGEPFDAYVAEIHREDDTNLWIGTADQGLFNLVEAGGSAEPVVNPVNGSRFTHPIMGVATDGPEVWISAVGYGVVEWHRDTGEATKHNRSLELITQEPRPSEIRIVGPEVWIATHGQGALMYNRTTEMWQAFANPDNLQAFVVYDMAVTGDEIWFSTDTGVSRYDDSQDRWRHWSSHSGLQGALSYSVTAGNGQVWTGTDKAINVYDRPRDTWVEAGIEGLSNAPPWNAIQDCTADGEDLLVGTGGGGAARYTPATGTWDHTYPIGEYGVDNLTDANAPAVLPTEEAIWFGTGKGISRLDRAWQDWSYYRTDGYQPPDASTKADKIKDLTQAAGTVWAATEQWGLAKYDQADDRFVLYNASDGLSSNALFSVAGQQDRVWVGSGGGLDIFNATTQEVTHVYPSGSSGNDTDGDDRDIVFDIVLDPDRDRVWIGTFQHGLQYVNTTSLEVHQAPGFEDFLPVQEILLQDDGLWAGGYRGELIEVPLSEDGTPGQPTVDESLVVQPQLTVRCLVETDGILYIGTLGGFYRYDTQTATWLNLLGTAEGAASTTKVLVERPTAGNAFQAGQPVMVEGQVVNATHGPIDVRARLGLGHWVATQPDDDGTFTLEVPTGRTAGGDTILLVRAVETGSGGLIDETAVPVTLEGAAASSLEEARIVHSPPLEGHTGDPVDLQVRGWDLPTGTTVTTVWTDATGEDHSVELDLEGQADDEGSPDRYQATLGPFESPTSLTYTLHVQPPGSEDALELPEPGGPFGSAYPLIIKENPGFVSLFAPTDPLTVTVERGSTSPLQVPIQNTGTRSSPASLNVTGEAADWLDLRLEDVTLEAFSTRQVQVTVDVPTNTTDGVYQAQLNVLPRVEPGASVSYPIEIQVGQPDQGLDPTGDGASVSSSDEENGDSLEVPGITTVVTVLATTAAAMVSRRSRKLLGPGGSEGQSREP